MIKQLLLLILFIPFQVFAQDNTHFELTNGGIFFMVFAWVSILTWNLVCFLKLLK